MNYQVLLTEMLQGTLMTLRIFFSTLVFALPLGLLVSLGRMSKIKIINWPVRLFILIMRGTPLMLQLLFVFYGLKPLFGIQLDRVIAAQVAFALNYAAYFAEIYRGGIESALGSVASPTMVVGISSDMIFPVSEQVFLYRHIPQCQLRLIDSPFGHDGFLVEYDKLNALLKPFIGTPTAR